MSKRKKSSKLKRYRSPESVMLSFPSGSPIEFEFWLWINFPLADIQTRRVIYWTELSRIDGNVRTELVCCRTVNEIPRDKYSTPETGMNIRIKIKGKMVARGELLLNHWLSNESRNRWWFNIWNRNNVKALDFQPSWSMKLWKQGQSHWLYSSWTLHQ